MKNLNRIFLLGISSALLAGCVPVMVATTTATVVTTAMDRRSTGTVVGDSIIEKRILIAITQEFGEKVKSHITVTAHNGRVLLSGEVESLQAKRTASRIAKASLDVVDVVNELMVGENAGFSQRLSDTALKKKVETILFTTKNIPSVQVKVAVDRDIVYLMGMLTKHENTAACQAIAKTSGVAKVVSLVELLTKEQIKQRMLINEKQQQKNQTSQEASPNA